MTTTAPDIAHLDHDLDPTCDGRDCDAAATWAVTCRCSAAWCFCGLCRIRLLADIWECSICATPTTDMEWKPL